MDAAIIDKLEENHSEKLTALTVNCFENFKDRREAVVWLFRMNAKAEAKVQWYEAAGISEERQVIVLIHILDLSYRDIDNQRETVEARKINKQVYNILFKDGALASLINNASLDTATRIYTFINDVKNLDPQDKINLRSRIQDRHPDFKFGDGIEKKTYQGLFVTKAKYEEKQKQLAYIWDVEIPAISKEIEAARLHGDFKENAEYISAKEKQLLRNTMAEKLKDEIDRAQLFDPATIDASKVSFGTLVVLHNRSKDRKEEYAILGPWESDQHHVISYLAPFGKVMLGKTEGEQFNFTSDGEKNSYTIESIRAVEL
jgi:transcription elongation GreA/GreB family factor